MPVGQQGLHRPIYLCSRISQRRTVDSLWVITYHNNNHNTTYRTVPFCSNYGPVHGTPQRNIFSGCILLGHNANAYPPTHNIHCDIHRLQSFYSRRRCVCVCMSIYENVMRMLFQCADYDMSCTSTHPLGLSFRRIRTSRAASGLRHC